MMDRCRFDLRAADAAPTFSDEPLTSGFFSTTLPRFLSFWGQLSPIKTQSGFFFCLVVKMMARVVIIKKNKQRYAKDNITWNFLLFFLTIFIDWLCFHYNRKKLLIIISILAICKFFIAKEKEKTVACSQFYSLFCNHFKACFHACDTWSWLNEPPSQYALLPAESWSLVII